MTTLIERVQESDAVAGFVSVPPPSSFHISRSDAEGRVESIVESRAADIWINGGYFVLRQEIFDHLHEGEELVVEPFARLIEQRRLIAMRHTGFWQNMDTFKDHVHLNDLNARDNVAQPLINQGVRSRVAKRKALDLLERLQMGHRAMALHRQGGGDSGVARRLQRIAAFQPAGQEQLRA